MTIFENEAIEEEFIDNASNDGDLKAGLMQSSKDPRRSAKSAARMYCFKCFFKKTLIEDRNDPGCGGRGENDLVERICENVLKTQRR